MSCIKCENFKKPSLMEYQKSMGFAFSPFGTPAKTKSYYKKYYCKKCKQKFVETKGTKSLILGIDIFLILAFLGLYVYLIMGPLTDNAKLINEHKTVFILFIVAVFLITIFLKNALYRLAIMCFYKLFKFELRPINMQKEYKEIKSKKTSSKKTNIPVV